VRKNAEIDKFEGDAQNHGIAETLANEEVR